jgi:hypothetical protein
MAAGLPQALAAVGAHGGGVPASRKASMGVAGLNEPPGGLQNDVATMGQRS